MLLINLYELPTDFFTSIKKIVNFFILYCSKRKYCIILYRREMRNAANKPSKFNNQTLLKIVSSFAEAILKSILNEDNACHACSYTYRTTREPKLPMNYNVSDIKMLFNVFKEADKLKNSRKKFCKQMIFMSCSIGNKKILQPLFCVETTLMIII